MTHTVEYKLRHAVARARSTQLKAHMRHNRYSNLQAKHTAARVMDDVQHRKRCAGRNSLYAPLHAQASYGVSLHSMLRSWTRPNKNRQPTKEGHVSGNAPPQSRERVPARTHATRQASHARDKQRNRNELPFAFTFQHHQEDTPAGACATSIKKHEGASPPKRAACSHEGVCSPDCTKRHTPPTPHTPADPLNLRGGTTKLSKPR
jgi:hypothetical protein